MRLHWYTQMHLPLLCHLFVALPSRCRPHSSSYQWFRSLTIVDAQDELDHKGIRMFPRLKISSRIIRTNQEPSLLVDLPRLRYEVPGWNLPSHSAAVSWMRLHV